MKTKKILINLMITFSIIIVSSCSSKEHTSNSQIGEEMINSSASSADNNENYRLSSKDQSYLELQQLKLNNIVYFDLDKYNIGPNFGNVLDNHAKFLSDNPSYKILVEGHADERGTPEYNIALGERRANAVKIYLQSRGVFADQISIISYGKEKPAAFGHNEEAYAKNRRAVLNY